MQATVKQILIALMKQRELRALFFFAALSVLSMQLVSFSAIRHFAGADNAFYVSPGGNDGASGSSGVKAFATLHRARDAIRELKKTTGLPEGGITVWIRGGEYYLEQGFELTSEDSGTAEAPIVYRAMPGERVRIIGGLEVSGRQKVRDQAILDRLAPAARGQVYQVDLRAQGIDDFGQLRSRGFGRGTSPAALELFFQDKPMNLARWPNDSFVKIAGFTEAKDDGHGRRLGELSGGFNYDGDRPNRWKDTNDIWVHGYWAYDWANSYEHIAHIDIKKRHIKTSPPYGNYGFRTGGRFYFLNVLEELDKPGEWYLDSKSGILYFWPPAPIEQGRSLVSILEEPMVHLNSTSYITIRGLAIECARGVGVRISGGSNNHVIDCTLCNLGNYGVTVNGGKDHSVVGCEIYQTGDGGISLRGGDRRTLTPANHFAYNNHIHHVARWSRCYVPAISMSGVGSRISNNLIHDHPHCAILFGGNDHLIELNEIHHVCLETGDVGAIYTGRDYTFRGNIIRHNFIHHTGGVGMGSMGIYMDDCVSGTQIYGNVLWKLHRAVFLGGGRDFKVENNIFIDCDPAVDIDGRGLSKSPVWHNMVYKTMKERLERMNWKQPPYSTRYPELADLQKYYARDDGLPPGNILVARNICVGEKWLTIRWGATKDMVTVRDNLVCQEASLSGEGAPHFVDAASGDFRLKDDSPAFELGFKRIPFEQIGLVKNTNKAEETVIGSTAKGPKDNSLYAGWASVDITPKKPVVVIGQLHKRIARTTVDPLTATVLALESRGRGANNEQAIMVSCDVIFIRKAIQQRIRDLVKQQIPDFDVRKLLLNATHTHTAPGFIDNTFKGLYDVSKDKGVMKASEYGDFFVERIAEAVVGAWQNRKPAGMSWALGHAVVGMNRRAHYFDGSSVMYGNTNAENFSNIEGSEDHAVEMLFFWGAEEKLTGIVINIACTSQETENLSEISADFWHDVREELRQRYSEDLFIFPQCAPSGDLSPHLLFRKKADEIMLKRRGISRRQEIARRIANAVDDVFPLARVDIKWQPSFRHKVVDLDLPENEPAILPFYETDSHKGIEFHVIRLGDIAIATNPFELYIDYGVRMKARSKAVLTLLVQLSCQNNGYLPTEKAVSGGGYSADKFVVGPKGGQILVNETVKTINELW
ncbi:MAG TPA: right-handed parallel beta-helix repeat-containing protein [Planctomycetes bacterium]|nr:right-handed parallel beta-helix repeat-containing protein [Planctomycetota bacterium]